ncbi:hypothetical protein EV401DRAFT_1896444 [Pisolithus croceorrhizus]|nr:hypothetical protein EV401DRAFT_1896444 [Pisolithus croceorrhizus]
MPVAVALGPVEGHVEGHVKCEEVLSVREGRLHVPVLGLVIAVVALGLVMPIFALGIEVAQAFGVAQMWARDGRDGIDRIAEHVDGIEALVLVVGSGQLAMMQMDGHDDDEDNDRS